MANHNVEGEFASAGVKDGCNWREFTPGGMHNDFNRRIIAPSGMQDGCNERELVPDGMMNDHNPRWFVNLIS